MKAWWNGLNPRERMSLLVGGAVLLLFILYVGVWSPLQGNLRQLETRAADQRAQLAWMRGAAAEVRQLRAQGGAPVATGGASLLTVVDRSARQGGLGGALQRVEPDGDTAVRVWLNQAPFNDLLAWLEGLGRKQGVTVSRIAIEHGDKDGLVNVRATLERAAR